MGEAIASVPQYRMQKCLVCFNTDKADILWGVSQTIPMKEQSPIWQCSLSEILSVMLSENWRDKTFSVCISVLIKAVPWASPHINKISPRSLGHLKHPPTPPNRNPIRFCTFCSSLNFETSLSKGLMCAETHPEFILKQRRIGWRLAGQTSELPKPHVQFPGWIKSISFTQCPLPSNAQHRGIAFWGRDSCCLSERNVNEVTAVLLLSTWWCRGQVLPPYGLKADIYLPAVSTAHNDNWILVL